MQGKINSIETMGLVDGPGIRFVVFMQGCQLRCKYCHNPETWQMQAPVTELSPQDLLKKIERYRGYFAKDGGVTFSGGEPLLQPDFLLACLRGCRARGIHSALDTAGVGFGDYVAILENTDLVILDIKAVDAAEYERITGCKMDRFNRFLDACRRLQKPLWLRQVIVPGINDDWSHVVALRDFAAGLQYVEKVELLPYKSLGEQKYSAMGLSYPLSGTPELSAERCAALQAILDKRDKPSE